jgi:ubiquinone/menaquinone biosynthesis C-methylase UbiE
MCPAKNFHEKSYKQHEDCYNEFRVGGTKEALAKTWLGKDSIGIWRFQRMYQILDPILFKEPKAKWLTVGDGRFGMDAKYILEKGCDATASDISDVLLKEAKDNGYIAKYKKENAESLSFKDSEFDYVFCKEAYHHFPRPMLALYEMLRVTSRGVVMIEPNDPYIDKKLPGILYINLINSIKSMLRIKIPDPIHDFEEAGNYVYSISKREIEKVALGLSYKVIAFKGINDYYIPGSEYEKLSENGPFQKKIKRKIAIRDYLCSLGLTGHTLLATIIFKQKPSEALLHQLAKERFEIIHLPDNPHISGDNPDGIK